MFRFAGFLFFIILALVLLGAAVVQYATSKQYKEARLSGHTFVAGGVATLALSLIFCMTIVPARTVGIPIVFGKPTGVIENGFHFIAPWSNVERLDLAVQNDVYNGDNAVDVRLANSSRARVDASIQWHLKPEGAKDTFLDYKSFDSIRSNLVDRNFRAALNEELAAFDPLDVVEQGAQDQKLAMYADKVKENLEKKVGDRIEIRAVTIPIVNFDESTQRRLDELVSEFANTRVAEQKRNTAKAEAEANKQLQQSVSQESLTSKCLDIVRETKQSPLGCFPGESAQPVKNVN